MPTKQTKKEEGIIENIMGLVKKSILAGLGMAFLGEEKIEEWAKKIAKENKLSPKDISNFIKDVKKESIQARKDVEQRLREMLKDFTSSGDEKPSEPVKKKPKSKKRKSSGSSVNVPKPKMAEPEIKE